MLHTLLFISGGEIILIMLVALLFFGSESIPDIARTLGKGLREFRKAANEIQREFDENTSDIKREMNEVKTDLTKGANQIKDDVYNVSNKLKEEGEKVGKTIEDGINDQK